MIAQLNKEYILAKPSKVLPRLLSYFFYEGRPATTKGRWFNPVTFLFLRAASKGTSSLSGKIRGVLTKYDTNGISEPSDYQFMIRTENDVNLTNPRLTIDLAPPVGGSAISYLGSFTENFESYTAGSITTGQTNFPKYINDPAVGFK